MLDGQLAWRQHDGGHTDGPNWKYFIPWADRQLKRAKARKQSVRLFAADLRASTLRRGPESEPVAATGVLGEDDAPVCCGIRPEEALDLNGAPVGCARPIGEPFR
jgi:hypothetical protein